MTETNMNTSNPYDGERIPGSVGLPLPGVEIRITDPETGRVLPQGEIGMIEIRGPNVFKGYWRMPEKTKAEFRDDGFFISGDLGYVDERGYVYISGRGKDLIISGGFNVYPAEVEGAIEALPGVAECAVIGVPHPDFGEGVVAVVMPKPGATLDEREMLRGARQRACQVQAAEAHPSSPTACPATPWARCRRRSCASSTRRPSRPEADGDACRGVGQERASRSSGHRAAAAGRPGGRQPGHAATRSPRGFEVTAVVSGRAALTAVAERPFAFAVVEMRLGDGNGLALVEQLRRRDEAMRIVVVTGFDSFASVVMALRAGAVDYLPKPANPDMVVDALLGRGTTLAPVPDTPLGIDRVCWEYIQRVFEQCGRNVTRTALQLRMHRRTLQRMLGKRAPRPRAHAPGATEAPVSRFRRQHAGSRRS